MLRKVTRKMKMKRISGLRPSRAATTTTTARRKRFRILRRNGGTPSILMYVVSKLVVYLANHIIKFVFEPAMEVPSNICKKRKAGKANTSRSTATPSTSAESAANVSGDTAVHSEGCRAAATSVTAGTVPQVVPPSQATSSAAAPPATPTRNSPAITGAQFTPFRITHGGTKARQQDASPSTKALLKGTNTLFRITMATKNPFLSDADVTNEVKSSFLRACRDSGAKRRIARYESDNVYSDYVLDVVRPRFA